MPLSAQNVRDMRFTRKRRSPQQMGTLDNEKGKRKNCLLCLSDEDNEIELGQIYEKEDLIVHYFCLLLGSGLCQNARVNDRKSILGFVLKDIRKEIKRGSRLKCCFCRKQGASIGCCIKTCKKAFHLCCGRKNETMHQFYGNFRSYCPDHVPVQKLKQNSSGVLSPNRSCAICFAPVSRASSGSLISPCCMRSCFHKICLQKYAISAGLHFFKCPLCNDVKEFQREMLDFGIYIPDQDASWEREPDAYRELLERHDTCDAPKCICPKGQKYDADSGLYELLLCGWCGSFGSHRACGGLEYREGTMMCHHCADITDMNWEKNKGDTSEGKDKSHIHSTPLPDQNSRSRRLRGQLLDGSVLPSAGSSYSQSVTVSNQGNISTLSSTKTENSMKTVHRIYLNGKSLTLDETKKFECFVRLEKIDETICMPQGEDLNKISCNSYKYLYGEHNDPKNVPRDMPSLIFMGDDSVLDNSLEGSPPVLTPPELTPPENEDGNMELKDSNPNSSSSENDGRLLGNLQEKEHVDNLIEVQQNCLHSLRYPPRDSPSRKSQENKIPKSIKKARPSKRNYLHKKRQSPGRSKNIQKLNVSPDFKQTSILDFFK